MERTTKGKRRGAGIETERQGGRARKKKDGQGKGAAQKKRPDCKKLKGDTQGSNTRGIFGERVRRKGRKNARMGGGRDIGWGSIRR